MGVDAQIDFIESLQTRVYELGRLRSLSTPAGAQE